LGSIIGPPLTVRQQQFGDEALDGMPTPTRIDPATPSFGPYALAALSARSEFVSWGVLEKDGRLLDRSGGVEVWWAPTPHWIVVVTRLPHRMIGLVWKQQASATSSSAARSETERMWQRFSVLGARLPWTTVP
jgi:hypothetical protein